MPLQLAAHGIFGRPRDRLTKQILEAQASMKRNLSTAAITAVLGIITAGAGWDAQPQPKTLDSAPQFRDRDGRPHALAELKGHVAVVNFWATWCIPCREEMPRLQRLSEEYTPRGVAFVALSLDDADAQKKIDQVVAKRGFRITVWTGATEQNFKELDLGQLVPSTLILDENGAVVGKIEGEARDKDIRSRLEWVLNGRRGKQPKILQKNDW